MKPIERLVDVVAILTLAMLTSACTPVTSDDDLLGRRETDRSEQERIEDAELRETAVLVASTMSPPEDVQPSSVAEPDPAPPRIAVSVADQLRQYLLSEFGTPGSEAPWYHRIRRVAVGLHTASIHTDLSADASDRVVGLAICRAVSTFPFSSLGRGVTSLDIAVLGRGGRLIAGGSYDPPRPTARIRPALTPIHAPQHNPPVFRIAPSPEAPPQPGPTGDR
jgi:hypothetical protein